MLDERIKNKTLVLIVKDKGLNGKTSTINFDTEQSKWGIRRWKYGEESSSAIGIELPVVSVKIEEIGIY